MAQKMTVSRPLSPEDVRPGDFIALLKVRVELPSFLWDSCALRPEKPVTIEFNACNFDGPLKVMEVCLPFIFAKAACGELMTLDVRQCDLARLRRSAAKPVWNALKERTRARRRDC